VTDINIGIGKIIRTLRRAAKISQEELAHRAGLHRTHVSQLERGLKSPTIATLAKVAKALNTTPSRIIKMFENKH
jgi:transcriptional regulator with XRE-family HTH domain